MSKNRSNRDKRALEIVKSVQSDLETVRSEERLGGVISQKENDELFYIDTVGKDSQASGASRSQGPAKPVKKMLKIDQILKPESAYTIGRSYQTKESRVEEALIMKKMKNIPRVKSVQATKSQKPAHYDAWADEDETVAAAVAVAENKKSKFVPIVPALSIPEAAASYNPQPEIHLAFLDSLENQEHERLARIRALKEQVPTNEATDLNNDLMVVANRKLVTGEVSEDEEENDDSLSELISKPNRKKTTADRKRQIRHRESLLESKKLRLEKHLLKQIDKAPEFFDQILTARKAREEAEKLLAPVKEKARHEIKLKRIRKRLTLEPLAIKLPEELPSSMRQLAPEGNLVADSFRNLIERGAVDVSSHKILSNEVKQKRIPSFKPKYKMVEKNSYKDFK